ncbi:MAG: hypothetical protein ISS10_01650 [Candidatus Marinimicrobia bacterium]|nr:hypothetical protein [Candidatus Neomarinimicrobiota bacterium]MBL7059683.1 hypothetical protein [Candidatus Neomarinimicrobiota bacterium]
MRIKIIVTSALIFATFVPAQTDTTTFVLPDSSLIDTVVTLNQNELFDNIMDSANVIPTDSVLIDTSLILNIEEELGDNVIDTTIVIDPNTVIPDSIVNLIEQPLEPQTKDTLEVEISSDQGALLISLPVEIPAEQMGLDYGYKGFPWGALKGQTPYLPYMDTLTFSDDSTKIFLTASLGQDDVKLTYAFADSGFWKVEIDYLLSSSNIDNYISDFLRIEKGIYEIYGPPNFTHKVEAGPTSAYTNLLNIKYSRAFYTSTWDATPCKIQLMLNSMVQVPTTPLPILEGQISMFRLVYYNPDFMIHLSDIPEPKTLPSIFDLY